MIKGELEAFCESGTEGVVWCLYDEHKNGYDSLHCISDGDYLEVYDNDGSIYWHGIISIEYSQMKNGKEVLVNYSRGVQEHLEPEYWARMFYDKRKAILIVKKKDS